MDRHAGPGGAQVAEGDTRLRGGIVKALQGLKEEPRRRREAVGRAGRHPADPGGRLADPVRDAGAGGGGADRADRATRGGL